MTTPAQDPLADLARLEGVPSACAAALAAVDTVLRDRGLRRIEVDDVAAAAWRSARAAVDLAGETGAAGAGDVGEQVDRGRLAAAVVRMLAELPAVAGLVRTAPGQAMARLHAVWGRGVVDDDALGVLRTDEGVSERIGDLSRLLTRPTTAPALVLAGVVHAELWQLQPFPQGSWAVALGMEQAVLMAAGVDPRGVIPLAAGHRDLGGHAAAVAGSAAGTIGGMRTWLEYEAAALTRAAELCPLADRA